MSDNESTTSLERSLPSTLKDYQDFVDEILAELEALGWAKEDLFAIHMALEESISNAIRHGNKMDTKKQVHVQCHLSPKRFWAEIRDEGNGFTPASVPDCRAPENLEQPGGRGLTLIRAYMTKVEYNPCGNCLTMEKILP